LSGSAEGATQLATHTARELNAALVSTLNDLAARVESLYAASARQSAPLWRVQSNTCWYFSWGLWYAAIVALAVTDPVAAYMAWLSAGAGTMVPVFCA
jgi:hypothetical protein